MVSRKPGTPAGVCLPRLPAYLTLGGSLYGGKPAEVCVLLACRPSGQAEAAWYTGGEGSVSVDPTIMSRDTGLSTFGRTMMSTWLFFHGS